MHIVNCASINSDLIILKYNLNKVSKVSLKWSRVVLLRDIKGEHKSSGRSPPPPPDLSTVSYLLRATNHPTSPTRRRIGYFFCWPFHPSANRSHTTARLDSAAASANAENTAPGHTAAGHHYQRSFSFSSTGGTWCCIPLLPERQVLDGNGPLGPPPGR